MRLPRPAPRTLRVLQVMAAVVLLVLLWRVVDGEDAARSLASADPLWLVAALWALTLQTVLSALRWRLTAAQFGISLGRRIALREYYLSQAVNQALPGGVLGDAGRAVRARAQAGLLASGQAVVFERLAGQIALFVVLAIAFVATFAVHGGFEWPDWLMPPVLALLVGGLVLPVGVWTTGRHLPGSAGRALDRLGRSFAIALAAPVVRWRQIGLSLGTALCNIAAFGFCAWAIGADLPVAAIAALVPLILFTMLVPVTVSGWGVREGAAALLFPLAGATAAQGLAASIAFGLVVLVSVLPGLVLLGARSAPGALES